MITMMVTPWPRACFSLSTIEQWDYRIVNYEGIQPLHGHLLNGPCLSLSRIIAGQGSAGTEIMTFPIATANNKIDFKLIVKRESE